jgi:hypothetical protein
MTASGGDAMDDHEALRRDVGRLQAQVVELRRTVLGTACGLVLVLMVLGLLLPAWSGTDSDGQHHTYRVLTAGFQVVDDSEFNDQRGLQVLLCVGFLGLVLVVVLLGAVLVSSVMGGHGSHRGGWVRRTLVVLAVVGSLVPLLLSAVAAGSDVRDTTGGWGPLVLLAGVVLAAVVLAYRPWQELWLERVPERGFRPLSGTSLES